MKEDSAFDAVVRVASGWDWISPALHIGRATIEADIPPGLCGHDVVAYVKRAGIRVWGPFMLPSDDSKIYFAVRKREAAETYQLLADGVTLPDRGGGGLVVALVLAVAVVGLLLGLGGAL